MQAAEAAIDRASKNLNLVEETPQIQLLQQNNVNISIDNGLSRDSRQRVIETVQALLNKSKSLNPVDVIDVKENDVEQE